MKVIDIIKDLAENKKMPHFKIYDEEYYIGDDGYIKDSSGDSVDWFIDTKWLNEEVEIIEEDKEIEKGIKPFEEYWEEIEMAGCDTVEAKKVYFDRLSKIVIELIKEVNELKKGK